MVDCEKTEAMPNPLLPFASAVFSGTLLPKMSYVVYEVNLTIEEDIIDAFKGT